MPPQVMGTPLEMILEEHPGLSPGFKQWHLVAKRGGRAVGVYYIHY